MKHSPNEYAQTLLDRMATGQLNRRRVQALASAAGVTAGASGSAAEHAAVAGENQARNRAQPKGTYDYVVVGGGASADQGCRLRGRAPG